MFSNLLIRLIREIYGRYKTIPRVFDNHQVFLKRLSGFLIYSDIRQIFSPAYILEICIGAVWKIYEIPRLLCLDPRVPKMLMKPLNKMGLDSFVIFLDGKTYLTAKFEAVSDI